MENYTERLTQKEKNTREIQKMRAINLLREQELEQKRHEREILLIKKKSQTEKLITENRKTREIWQRT